MSTVSQETFFAALRQSVQDAVTVALEAEIDEACERLRANLREQAAHIALRMMDTYDAQQMGRNLVITVRSLPSPSKEENNG